MNIKRYTRLSIIASILLMFSFTSCVKDLDTLPLDKDVKTGENVLTGDASYKELLAKCYAGYVLGGQTGVDGTQDISSINGGFSSYLRQYWNLQELPTDEAICGWADGSLPDIHEMDWNATNEFVAAMYYRINLEIAYCNNLIKLTTGNDKYKEYRTEARMLRALAYSHLIDMFGTGPMVTDKDNIGSFFFPKQATTKELFTYVETELKAIESELKAPRTNEYGRADQGAAWMVLAKLYLNAKVYIGEEKFSECITYCNKLIGAGYSLENKYTNLFLADNHLRNNEIIFPIAADGEHSQTWGGMTFLIHSTVGGAMKASDFGIDGGWGGNRSTEQFVALFPDTKGTADKRSHFYGTKKETEKVGEFTDGLSLGKFKNVTSTGVAGQHQGHPDTDFPLFRFSDVYLMYAEAVLRGGAGGDAGTALSYVNKVRARAYEGNTGDITSAQLTLDFLLDERGRELYWEGHRRTDLRRFGKLTGADYLWSWKGNIRSGQAVDAKFNVYPIPAADINANKNLTQTAGY